MQTFYISNVAESGCCVLGFSEDELGGSSGDCDRLLSSPKVGRDSKIDNDNAASHEQVSDWCALSPFIGIGTMGAIAPLIISLPLK